MGKTTFTSLCWVAVPSILNFNAIHVKKCVVFSGSWEMPHWQTSHSFESIQFKDLRCVPNWIYHPPKGTLEWKKSWPPYWRVVPNQCVQNWPLQRALRNEGFRRVQLMDTSAPMILCRMMGHIICSIWARDDDAEGHFKKQLCNRLIGNTCLYLHFCKTEKTYLYVRFTAVSSWNER